MVYSMDKDGLVRCVGALGEADTKVLFDRTASISVSKWSDYFKGHFKSGAIINETTGKLSGHNVTGSGS